MLNQILRFLLETFFGLFVFVLLARFYMQTFRASFHNPIGGFVLALTNWIVLPTRRLVPSIGGFDLASLFAAWLAETILLYLLFSLRSFDFGSAPGIALVLLLLLALFELARTSIYLLIGAVILQALLSWVNPYTPLAPMLNALTRPFYRVFQRLLPPVGGIDLSPLFLLVLLQVALFLLAYAQAIVSRLF
jgi:YggT family protein